MNQFQARDCILSTAKLSRLFCAFPFFQGRALIAVWLGLVVSLSTFGFPVLVFITLAWKECEERTWFAAM